MVLPDSFSWWYRSHCAAAGDRSDGCLIRISGLSKENPVLKIERKCCLSCRVQPTKPEYVPQVNAPAAHHYGDVLMVLQQLAIVADLYRLTGGRLDRYRFVV